MRPHKFSRFWPCEVLFQDGWGSGTAVLQGDVYQCIKCDATWYQDGDNHPDSQPVERTIV